MDFLNLDSIFEQTINGQTKAAQSMKERLANYRMRRLQHAQRTRLFFHEIQPQFFNTGGTDEIITAYSDEFGQALLVVAGITNLVVPRVRFSDTVTNTGWSGDPVPLRIYAGKAGNKNGHQLFTPQLIPAHARIVGDFINPAVFPTVGAFYGEGRVIFLCYYIAPASPPASPQELDALKVAEARIKEGTPPRQIALAADLKVDGNAGVVTPGETKPNAEALLITGLTLNVPNDINARIMISDSSTNQGWMKKRVTMWGVAGNSFNGDAPVLRLPKPYYLPAGAVMRVEFENTPDGSTGPAAPAVYTYSFIGETP